MRIEIVSVESGVEAESRMVEVAMIGSVCIGRLLGPWCGRKLGLKGSAGRGAAWIRRESRKKSTP